MFIVLVFLVILFFSRDEEVDLDEGGQHLMRYKSVSHLLHNGAISITTARSSWVPQTKYLCIKARMADGKKWVPATICLSPYSSNLGKIYDMKALFWLILKNPLLWSIGGWLQGVSRHAVWNRSHAVCCRAINGAPLWPQGKNGSKDHQGQAQESITMFIIIFLIFCCWKKRHNQSNPSGPKT